MWVLPFAFQGCPRKAQKSSSLQLPKRTSRAVKPQEHLLSLISAQQGALPSFHGWEHMPAWLRWTGMLNTQCQGTGSGQQDWGGTYFLQHSWNLLLRGPWGWDSMWYKEASWMNQPETLPWLQLPYNLLCFKLCFQAWVQPLNGWQMSSLQSTLDSMKCCLLPGQSDTTHLLSKGESIISQISPKIPHPALLQEKLSPCLSQNI